MDKAVDLLLEYMESNETVSQQVRSRNSDAIERNNEGVLLYGF